MDTDAALKVIDQTERDFEIKNPIFLGLEILVRVTKDELDMRFEHDQMWTGDFEETVSRMPKEAVVMMAKLGWFESEESWSHF